MTRCIEKSGPILRKDLKVAHYVDAWDDSSVVAEIKSAPKMTVLTESMVWSSVVISHDDKTGQLDVLGALDHA